MFESGLVVALGLAVTFWKLRWNARMWMLSHPLIIDVAVFVALNYIHWGTASGVMTAAVAALTCSLMLSLGRYLFGYKVGALLVPGKFSVQLDAEPVRASHATAGAAA